VGAFPGTCPRSLGAELMPGGAKSLQGAWRFLSRCAWTWRGRGYAFTPKAVSWNCGGATPWILRTPCTQVGLSAWREVNGQMVRCATKS